MDIIMYDIGEKITTKKTHPCGGNEWTVVRNGADYKLKCDKCGRVIIITPEKLKKMEKPKSGSNK